MIDDCLAQFSSKCVFKEEQRQAVLGLLEQKDVVAVLPTGFEKSLRLTSCSQQWNLNEAKRIWNLLHPHYEVLSMNKLKQWEKLAFQSLHDHAAEPWGDVDILFFKCSLSWKLAFRCFDTVLGDHTKCFSITLKLILSLSDHYNIFTNDWLWIEVCQNTVFSKIDITMTTINKKL